MYLGDDLTSHNRLSNLMLPLGLKWPTSPPLSPTRLPTGTDYRSPALYPSRFQFSFPRSHVFSASNQRQQTLTVRQATTAGDETRAACGFGNCATHIGGQFFFYPLKMLNTQILNPGPALVIVANFLVCCFLRFEVLFGPCSQAPMF